MQLFIPYRQGLSLTVLFILGVGSAPLVAQRRIDLPNNSSSTTLAASVPPQARIQAAPMAAFLQDGTAMTTVRLSYIVTPSASSRVRLWVRSLEPVAGVSFSIASGQSTTGKQDLLSRDEWKVAAMTTADVSAFDVTLRFTRTNPLVESLRLEWRWEIVTPPGL